MGAPKGNRFAAKDNRLLTSTLVREIKQDPERALKVVTRLIQSAIDGEPWAQSLIWDRVDGKVTQIVGGDPDSPIEMKAEITFVKAD